MNLRALTLNVVQVRTQAAAHDLIDLAETQCGTQPTGESIGAAILTRLSQLADETPD